MLRSIERKYTIAITSAYRTVATDAAGALAGCPPLDLLAWERARNWEQKGRRTDELNREVMEKWQNRWSQYTGWASVFIKDVEKWQRKAPPTDYYSTQAITGHGCFGRYLKWIKKMESDECWFGCEMEDTPEHTVFVCARFDQKRIMTETEIGESLTKEKISETLTRGDSASDKTMKFLREIMKLKADVERSRKEEGDVDD